MNQQYMEKEQFLDYLKEVENVFLVCGKSFFQQKLYEKIVQCNKKISAYSEIQPNPQIYCVEKGVKKFLETGATVIVAAGGGSAIDVAKGIKAYVDKDFNEEYMEKEITENEIELITIPTTAGSGSEATHFSVVYRGHKKLSITHKSLLPQKVVLLPELLDTLPIYQRKCTMLDAICHGIESYWSINATEESRIYSQEAIRGVVGAYQGYLANKKSGNRKMLEAANKAGQAINLTFTTGAHAMSYGLTTKFKIAHGHAVALCLQPIWSYMVENSNDAKLNRRMEEIARFIGVSSRRQMNDFFNNIMKEVDFTPITGTNKDVEELVKVVDKNRMLNHPLKIEENICRDIYKKILMKE